MVVNSGLKISIANILPIILLCVQQNKEFIQIWYNLRVRTWWQNCLIFGWTIPLTIPCWLLQPMDKPNHWKMSIFELNVLKQPKKCIAFVKHLQYFWAYKARRLKSLGLCTDLVFFSRLWMCLHNNWEILVRLLIITARRFHGQDGRAGFWWKCSGGWCVGALLNNSHQIIILKCPEKCHQTSIQLACEDRANNYIYL